MDEQIGMLQQNLRALQQQLHQGTVYQSLGTRMGQLIDGVRRHRRTPIDLPTEDDQVNDLLDAIHQRLAGTQPATVSLAELATLLEHLRSVDPRVRYTGVHFTLYDALEAGVFPPNQLNWLMDQLLSDQRLFDHVLEPANQAVFGRSAAVSFLATLVHYGNDHPERVTIDYPRLVQQVATYLCLETDTRGFINGQGWAHAFTSVTALLTALNDSTALPRADKLFLMTAFFERFKRLTTPLIYGETDRMGNYLVALTNRHPLYEDACLQALKRWRHQVAMRRRSVETAAGWNRYYNRQRLLDAMQLHRDLSPQIRAYLTAAIDFLA